MDIATFAGTVSTVLFAGANLPMIVKAVRTRDLRSYSVGFLLTGNVANLVHTVYVMSLPFGPVWVLHGFYLVSMGAMLCMWVMFRPTGAGAPTAVRFGHDGRERRPHTGASGVFASRLAAGARRVRHRARR